MAAVAPSGWLHLAFFGIIVPISAIRSQKLIERHHFLPQRRRYFVSILAQVLIFTAFSVVVARFNGIEIFPRAFPPRGALLAGCAFLAIAVPFGWTRWTKAVRERKRIVALFMPTDKTESALWVASAAVAGFGEEATWRGVQMALLLRLTGNVLAAAAICVVMFSIAHAVQGWSSVGAISVFAAAFHVIVWMSGSLYVAMAVHFIYDLIAGFSYAYLGRKLGYPGFGVRSSGFGETEQQTPNSELLIPQNEQPE
ncbi:MAG TPA: CPBP family glutamic-type intramembrane protease [Thermoanaerobaculia bacterium]